jgi:hypothetical protein
MAILAVSLMSAAAFTATAFAITGRKCVDNPDACPQNWEGAGCPVPAHCEYLENVPAGSKFCVTAPIIYVCTPTGSIDIIVHNGTCQSLAVCYCSYSDPGTLLKKDTCN